MWVIDLNFAPSDMRCPNCGRISKTVGITEENRSVLDTGRILGALRE
jgi:hypothetical protein